MPRNTLPIAVSLFALAVAATAHQFTADDAARIDATSKPLKGELSLAEIRRLTEKYKDVEVALADGYLRDPGDVCDTAEMMGFPPELGAMGIHFVRPDLLGLAPDLVDGLVDGNGTHVDWRQPSVLIYEPHSDGSLQLVAVENLTFKKAWHAAGNTEPPSLHGVAYDSMEDDPATAEAESHMFAPHYDRHIWLFRENPNGVFAQFNPAVSCADHLGPTPHDHGAQLS